VVIALRLHDSKSAASYYRSFVEQLSKAGNDAASSASRAELGAALLEAGLTGEAVAELSVSLAVDPSNVNTIILLARAYLGQNQIPSAGRTLESAVARGIDSAAIYAALSDVYERSGHVENAIPAMRLAIQRDPKNEAYWFRYGMLLTDSKAPAAAVIRLQEALKVFPQSSRLWFALGIAHFAEHRTDEAAKAFARAVELDSKFAPALAYLGLTSAEEGRYGDAIAFYERSLAMDDKLAATHYLLADALLKQASLDKDRIESHLTRAVVLDPSFAPARLALGKLYFRLVRLPEAVEQFQRVVELNPNLAEAHYHLGQIYRRLKKINDSQTEFATFARLSDNQREQAQTDRKEIVRRLANVRF
jgi:tetratricopeptide (TPR) repeat protein